MCYGYKPVIGPNGKQFLIHPKEYAKLEKEGKLVFRKDGLLYAKDTIPQIIIQSNEQTEILMRWDLIPRDFLKKENLPLAEIIKRKNSRAKDSKGFNSYNARLETVENLWAFRRPWHEGQRCVTSVELFRERANMDGAPKEFKDRSYNVIVKGEYYLAGLWDKWENNSGEELISCTIIKTDSTGNSKIRSIWHER